jgi:hypothetical protein
VGERKPLFFLGGAFMLGIGLVAFEFAPETWVRWLAFLALVSLPVIGFCFYQLGLTEARGRLRGIDQGVDRVSGMAATVVDLRASSATLMRQAARPEPLAVDLPQVGPSITVRRLESGEVEL